MSLTVPEQVTVLPGAEPDDRQRRTDPRAYRFPLPALTQLRVRLPDDRVLSWLAALVVTGIAGVIRVWGIGFPPGVVFDEVYYSTEAREMLTNGGYENNPGYMFIVHPPLGKWFIALGEWLLTDRLHWAKELGWRLPSALAGTLAVLILVRVVRRLTRSTLLGCVAGLLLALDGLSVVQSRVALLDIFLQTLVLAGFGCLVLDRDMVRTRLATAAEASRVYSFGPSLGARPWRLAGGVLLGLACGVKWSAVYFLAGFAVLSVLWDRAARRSAGVRHPGATTALRDLPGAALALGVVPALTYLATWTGWFLSENGYNRHWADDHPSRFTVIPGVLRSLLQYHQQMLDFHNHLRTPHFYQSEPWSWLVDGRAISYYYPSGNDAPTGCGAETCVREILAIGTPALWWLFLPALVWMVWLLVSRRDWRAGAVLMAFAAGWLTWMVNLERTMFLFYMVPLVPFLVIGVTLLLGDVLGSARASESRRLWGTAAVCGYLGLVAANLAWLHPLLVGQLVTYDRWHAVMWFASWI
ncbi:MAG TPA: phospholipid carrier-dependent glycosyltransferase [Mycobacteriales bacterium]|nr:phospholipid carrier-dependent glycosyltransferase [Mycobacteriales bacterium]